MPQDRRLSVDIELPYEMSDADLASHAQSMIGRPHTDSSGKVIGEVRSAKPYKDFDGKTHIIAEIKLSQNVILG